MNIKTVYTENTNLTLKEAEQIIELLNTNKWSRPSKPYTVDEIVYEQDFFLALNSNNIIVGLLRLKKVQWYQWELYNLVIAESHRRKGIAQSLITSAEQYIIDHKGGIMQATIDPQNTPSKKLFKKLGWKYSISFIHPAYKKPYGVWHKAVS